MLILPQEQDIAQVFRGADVPLNCEFYVAHMIGSEVSIWEVYHINAIQVLEVHIVGSWSFSNGLQWTHVPLFERRGDLLGMTFTVVHTNVSCLKYLFHDFVNMY